MIEPRYWLSYLIDHQGTGAPILMSVHRYPKSNLLADYARATIGILLTSSPLALIPINTIAGSILTILVGLFLLFALRTWVRGKTIVNLTDEGLAVSTVRHYSIQWRDLEALELRYFAMKRDRSKGWMQLTLKSSNSTIKFESSLEDFETVARKSAEAASRRNLALSTATLENLRSLDLPTDHLKERGEHPVD